MFKFSHPTESNSFLARAVTVLAATALMAGTGLLAGCPSNSNNEQSSAPPPVAQAAVFGGVINGGRQPVVNAAVIVYASETAPGALPVRIGQTTTDPNGRFTIAAFAPAPVTGQMIYVVAKGGNAGAGVNNSLKLMTIAGIQGSTLTPVPETVNINELSTVASTAALQGYLQFVDCSKVGGTAGNSCVAVANRSGMLSMAVTVRNLVNVVTGQATAFLSEGGITPLLTTQQKMDTLANALAGCVNTASSSGTPSGTCQSLFQAAGAGNTANTLKVAFLAAASPVANARGAAFYNLALPNPIFSPTLEAAPSDWTVGGQQFAYAVNSANDNISAWRLSPLTGVMTPVTTGGAGACGTTSAENCFDAPSGFGQAKLVSVSPNGRFAFLLLDFLTSGGQHTTSLAHYRIDPATGALYFNGAIGFLVITGAAKGLVLSPNGRFAYMLNGCATSCPDAGNSIWEGTINPDTGAFSPISTDTPVPTDGTGAAAIGMSPNGRFAFVVNTCGSGTCGNGNSTLSAFEVNAATGALSLIGAPAALSAASNASGQGANGITLGAQGRFAFITDNANSQLTSYQYTFEEPDAGQGVQPHQSGISIGKINTVPTGSDPTSVTGTGTVTTCPNSAGVGNGSNGLSPHLPRAVYAGRVYVTNGGDNTVTSVTASPQGTLGTPSTTAAGTNPSSAAPSSDGCTLYVTNGGGDDVNVYGANPGTASGGATLTPVTVSSTFPAGATPQGGAVAASGRFFYAGNAGDATLSAWQVDTTTGMLVPVAGNACPTGGHHNCFGSTGNPLITQALATSPIAGYLFMANANGAPNGNIPAFAMDGGSGALIAVPGSPFGTGIGSMEWLTISPNGRVLYSVSQNGEVSSFGIGANGSLTAALDSATTGETPQFVAGDPSGGFLYVGNSGGGISAYTTAQSGAGLGIMTPVTGGGAASCPFSSATNCFWARDSDGIALVSTAQAGTVLYAVSGFGNGEQASVISVWAVASATAATPGALTALANLPGVGSCGGHIGDGGNCYPAGYFPQILVASPDGKYLYASNQDNDNDVGMVSAWKINADGSLTPITGGGAGACGVAAGTDPDNCFAVGTTTNPDQISVSPLGNYLYVVNSGDIANSGAGSVTVFAIAPANSANPGALEALGTAAPPVSPPTGGTPTSIATSPPRSGGPSRHFLQ